MSETFCEVRKTKSSRKYRDLSPYCAGYCDKFHAIDIGTGCYVRPDAYIKCKILPKVNSRERFL